MPSSSSQIGPVPAAVRALPPLIALAVHVLRTHVDFPGHVGSAAPVRPSAARPAAVAATPVDAVNAIDSALLPRAAQRGDTVTVNTLLRAGAPVDGVSREGHTALALAARSGHSNTATALLEAHANPDAAGFGGVTPLMLAANSGFGSMVKLLAAHGANTEAVNSGGCTALMVAIHSNRLQAVNALLASGASSNASTPRGDPLQMAAGLGRLDIVRALVKFEANLHPEGNAFMPALIAAAIHGHLDVVGVLESLPGVDINANLRIAAANGMTDAVAALLRAGADPNEVDSDNGYTALMVASLAGHLTVVDILVKAGANLNDANDAGVTAFAMAVANGHMAVVVALKNAGVDIDSYLWSAVESGRVHLVSLLARAGGNVNVADEHGVTMLMRAAIAGDVDVVYALLQAGANVHGRLPMAEQEGNADAAGLPIYICVGVHTVLVNGFTALMLAALHRHMPVAAALMQFGADIDADMRQAISIEANMRLAASRNLVSEADAFLRAGPEIETTDAAGPSAPMLAAQSTALPADAALIPAVDGNGAAAAMPGNAPTVHALWQDEGGVPAIWFDGPGARSPERPIGFFDLDRLAAADQASGTFAPDALPVAPLLDEAVPANPGQDAPSTASFWPGNDPNQMAMDMDWEPAHSAAAPGAAASAANAPDTDPDPEAWLRAELVGIFQPS